MEGRYSEVNMSRKQAQQIAFSILADIESYVEAHTEEYKQFLQEESQNEKGSVCDDTK